MANLIVGITENCAPQQLETSLSSSGVDTSRLCIVMKGVRSAEHDSSAIDFIFVGENVNVEGPSEELEHGTGMFSDSGGTSVPGLRAPRKTLVGFNSDAVAPNYLGRFAIPEDEIANFNDAVAADRCVLVYTVDPSENGDAVKNSFKAAGLHNVRTY